MILLSFPTCCLTSMLETKPCSHFRTTPLHHLAFRDEHRLIERGKVIHECPKSLMELRSGNISEIGRKPPCEPSFQQVLLFFRLLWRFLEDYEHISRQFHDFPWTALFHTMLDVVPNEPPKFSETKLVRQAVDASTATKYFCHVSVRALEKRRFATCAVNFGSILGLEMKFDRLEVFRLDC